MVKQAKNPKLEDQKTKTAPLQRLASLLARAAARSMKASGRADATHNTSDTSGDDDEHRK